MSKWQPAPADVTPHLRRWLEGGATDEQTAALTAMGAEAAASVVAEVGYVIPPQYQDQAKTAAVWLVAYRYLRSWHPDEDDLLLDRFRDDYRDEMDRLILAVGQTHQEQSRRKFGSPRLGSDFIRA